MASTVPKGQATAGLQEVGLRDTSATQLFFLPWACSVFQKSLGRGSEWLA